MSGTNHVGTGLRPVQAERSSAAILHFSSSTPLILSSSALLCLRDEGPMHSYAAAVALPDAQVLRWKSSAKRTTSLPQDDKGFETSEIAEPGIATALFQSCKPAA